MNRLFVAYKPPFISSNDFLFRIKRKYKVKKAGFSGTLDPFACGTLIVAFGAYTKLFRFLQKYPKRYRATLWLGAKSESLDIENITSISFVRPFPLAQIQKVLKSFHGDFTYTPPKFSAKKINGKRAYKLAAQKKETNLSQVTSHIHTIRLIRYNHPFITFETDVSEGTYIRSLGEHIAKKLGATGTLSYLERLREGAFMYENEKELNPLCYLDTIQNFTSLSCDELWHGKKMSIDTLTIQKDGIYHIVCPNFFTIIEIEGKTIRYLLNQIPLKASYARTCKN